MNSAYIGKLMELAEKDHDVIHMLADSGTGSVSYTHLTLPTILLV